MEEEPQQNNALRGLAGLAIKLGGKLVGKLLFTKIGLISMGLFCVLVLAMIPLVLIFDNVAQGDLNGSDQVNQKDKTLIKKYRDAAASSFPGVQTDTGEELNYRLRWRLLYAVDFYSAEIGKKEKTKETKTLLPFNDLDQLALKLAPSFSYKTGTVKITVKTKKKVKKENPATGTMNTVTKTITDTDQHHVKLLKKVMTYKGNYFYAYQTKTKTRKSGNSTITVTKPVIANVRFQKDFSRFNNLLIQKLNLDEISPLDRKMVLETSRSVALGDNHLGFLIGEPGLITGQIGGIDLSSLPAKWLQAFKDAGKSYNVNWRILVAIAFVESTFQPDAVGPPNPSGELAEGMMQFLPSTWETFGVDGNRDGKADPFNAIDAIYSAAYYLSYLKIGEQPKQALYRYSGGSHAYVKKVLRLSRTMTVRGGGGRFTWPVPTSSRITSPYGLRIHPISGSREFHNGIDIGASCGSPIVAAEGGTVIASGPATGFGDWIVIAHGKGLTSIYGHMYKRNLFVRKGEHVKKGQVISRVGSNGDSTGCHLHFQVERNGKTVDPMQFLTI
ncbi:MAG TPA: peptidoglycan DD-metalloendopeptidase family protein, partial [Bacillales bacterium]